LALGWACGSLYTLEVVWGENDLKTKDGIGRGSSAAAGAETPGETMLREFLKEQTAVAYELIETGRLLLEHAALNRRVYDERMRRLGTRDTTDDTQWEE
jgi:hypothetical protein